MSWKTSCHFLTAVKSLFGWAACDGDGVLLNIAARWNYWWHWRYAVHRGIQAVSVPCRERKFLLCACQPHIAGRYWCMYLYTAVMICMKSAERQNVKCICLCFDMKFVLSFVTRCQPCWWSRCCFSDVCHASVCVSSREKLAAETRLMRNFCNLVEIFVNSES